jgi:hypothetical protein
VLELNLAFKFGRKFSETETGWDFEKLTYSLELREVGILSTLISKENKFRFRVSASSLSEDISLKRGWIGTSYEVNSSNRNLVFYFGL